MIAEPLVKQRYLLIGGKRGQIREWWQIRPIRWGL